MNVFQKLIGTFRPPAPPPAPAREPASARFTNSYAVTEDGLAPQGESEDELRRSQDLYHQANEILRTMKYARELKGDDNSPSDSDRREGHVLLEKHGFESHNSEFHLTRGEVQVSGDNETIHTTKVSDNPQVKNQSAVWHLNEKTLVLNYEIADEILNYPKFEKG